MSKQTFGLAELCQSEEESQSEFSNQNNRAQIDDQGKLNLIIEMNEILNSKKKSNMSKFQLVNSVLNKKIDESGNKKYIRQHELYTNIAMLSQQDNTISRGSKSQESSSINQNSDISDITFCKASSAQSKNQLSQNLAYDEQNSQDKISNTTIHKKSTKGLSSQSNKLQQEVAQVDNLYNNQIIQVETSEEVEQNGHLVSLKTSSHVELLSNSYVNPISNSSGKNSSQLDSNSANLSSQSKEIFTSSNDTLSLPIISSNSSKQQMNSLDQQSQCSKQLLTEQQNNLSKTRQNEKQSNQIILNDKSESIQLNDQRFYDKVQENRQDIDILKEETYIKKDEVIFVDKGKSVYAVQNSTINFAKLLSKDILKNLQRQSQKIQVEELENYLQQLNEHKQTENITQHIQVFQNELQKKYIEQNISDEDILVKNYGLIQHIKNQVRCTDKKNIEQIFVGVYRRKYQIIKYLTSGGQADILIGKYINDQGQDTEYVIRITSSDEDTFNYIKEEYELVKKFKKANNIIEYYDSIYFEDINTGVFIVEKCSQSLTEVLRGKRNGYTNFNELEICQIVFDLVQGLIDMRSHNILHQDIKPDNILVNKDGNYVFSDFGCSSKFLDGLAENKGFTMKYCAPEQLIEEYFTNYKADIYQLGRTIQQILEFYEKQGGVQTKFIKDLNQIIFNNMIQESQEKRKECIDIFALLCDLVIENNYKSFIEKLAGKIKKQLEGQQMSIEKETRFYLDQQIKYHFILLQIKFYQQDGYILLIQNKSKQQILSEIWNKISKDLFLLNEGENQNQQQLQLPQNIDILHGYFSSLSDLAECYFQNNEDEDCFFIGQLLLKISEKTNHNNIDHLLDAIQLLQKQLYKSINLSKYIKYIEDLEDSKQDQNIFKILASEYYHKDINKSFYFSLKLYAYYYKQYVQFSESDDQQDGDLIVYHGYYYLNSLLNLTNIFSEWEMDEVVQGNMQFIRQASHQLQLDKQFEKQYSTFGVQFFNLKQYNKAITFFEHELSREIENSKENKIKSNLFIIYKFKIGECYHKQSKFEQANQIFMELLQIFEQNIYQKDFVNNNFIKIQTLFHVGYYNFQKKKYMNAIIYFTELLQFLKNDIQKETNFYKLYYPNCLHYLGICYCQEETYDKEESTTYLKKFLDSLKDKDINGLEQDQKKQIYVSLHTLGYFNFEEENFKESEYYFTKLLKSFAQTTDYDDELFNNCLRYLLSSIVYQDQTQDSFYHKFIDIIIETVQFKAITDEKSKADILKNIKMGFKYSSYLESEDEKFLKNAELISILENLELEETEEYVMVQNYQAFIMFENGQYEESIIYYQKTLPIMKKIFSYPNQYVAIVQSSLGMAQHQLKQFQIAIIYYEQALNTMKDLKYYENNQTHQDMITCIDRILICFNGFGNNLQALKFYRNFENIIPVLYSQSHSTTIKFNKQYETCKKILADQNQTQKQNI